MSQLRCYNCGLPGHKTQICPRYGPRYPEPGKTVTDYAEENQRILNLFAADIVEEHDEGDMLTRPRRIGPRTPGDKEAHLRQFYCTYCGAQPGRRCQTKAGQAGAAHLARANASKEAGVDIPD